MKVIVIAGEPAVGKSTLMKRVIERIGWSGKEITSDGFVYTVVGLDKRVAVLGFYEEGETFGGTDRYAMNIQSKAETALEELAEKHRVLLFEGDRLFNAKFLESLHKRFPMKVFLLEANAEEKEKRHSKRGDSQNKTWLAGRATKLENILKYNNAMKNRYRISVLTNETEQELQSNTDTIIQEINNGR